MAPVKLAPLPVNGNDGEHMGGHNDAGGHTADPHTPTTVRPRHECRQHDPNGARRYHRQANTNTITNTNTNTAGAANANAIVTIAAATTTTTVNTNTIAAANVLRAPPACAGA